MRCNCKIARRPVEIKLDHSLSSFCIDLEISWYKAIIDCGKPVGKRSMADDRYSRCEGINGFVP